jgi:hypothetical protein
VAHFSKAPKKKKISHTHLQLKPGEVLQVSVSATADDEAYVWSATVFVNDQQVAIGTGVFYPSTDEKARLAGYLVVGKHEPNADSDSAELAKPDDAPQEVARNENGRAD